MHRALSSRWLRSALSISDRAAAAELPGFLCPALSSSAQRGGGGYALAARSGALPYRHRQQRCVHTESEQAEPRLPVESGEQELSPDSGKIPTRRLPVQCHGCGAFSQTSYPDQAGYFDTDRKVVRDYLGLGEGKKKVQHKKTDEDFVVSQAMQQLNEDKMAELGLDPKTMYREEGPEVALSPSQTPVCDRCHQLLHHNSGESIYHPTVDALSETIEESPYKHNHIYHVIDAADFPMSFIPRLHMHLGNVSLRKRNRRSRAGRYYQDRKFDMSFIITRADLLAPTEKQVNNVMPYLREVLRDALGEYGKGVRLGNVRCVSARRSWWTKELKQEIYKRGGAGWMVGKANVGKSELFQAVFPKGTTVSLPNAPKDPVEVDMFARDQNARYVGDGQDEEDPLLAQPVTGGNETGRLDVNSLLPPARAEVNYPEMPTISPLPGTTASPIRIPFGNGKGELIDLPGLPRSDLELFVKPEHQRLLVLQDRIKPEQYSIKPGQSLVIGGLIRITPRDPSLVFLGYNFTPFDEHLTRNDKAIEFHEQKREIPTAQNVATPEAASKMGHAGSFKVRHDVTKLRAGPITRKDAINISIDRLPYRVLSMDILIEGVGWVEITTQVRTKNLFASAKNNDALRRHLQEQSAAPEEEQLESSEAEEKTEPQVDPFEAMEKMARGPKEPSKRGKQATLAADGSSPEPAEAEPNWPVVDVYSPLGKFVGSRAPLNGYLLNKPRVLAKHKRARPRKSMKGEKKMMKMRKREAAAAARQAAASEQG